MSGDFGGDFASGFADGFKTSMANFNQRAAQTEQRTHETSMLKARTDADATAASEMRRHNLSMEAGRVTAARDAAGLLAEAGERHFSRTMAASQHRDNVQAEQFAQTGEWRQADNATEALYQQQNQEFARKKAASDDVYKQLTLKAHIRDSKNAADAAAVGAADAKAQNEIANLSSYIQFNPGDTEATKRLGSLLKLPHSSGGSKEILVRDATAYAADKNVNTNPVLASLAHPGANQVDATEPYLFTFDGRTAVEFRPQVRVSGGSKLTIGDFEVVVRPKIEDGDDKATIDKKTTKARDKVALLLAQIASDFANYTALPEAKARAHKGRIIKSHEQLPQFIADLGVSHNTTSDSLTKGMIKLATNAADPLAAGVRIIKIGGEK